MLVENVKKMHRLDRFLYWVKERHEIFLKRAKGEPKPWTDDKILQNYFFTNPYRENDKTTIWFRDFIRNPLRNQKEVVFATIAFRWFSFINTGILLLGDAYPFGKRYNSPKPNLLIKWNPDEALERLREVRKKGERIFTGGYIISSQTGIPKIESIVERIDKVWNRIDFMHENWHKDTSIKEAHSKVIQYEGIGKFMGYEIVTDLRHTYYLENAPDIMTWANPGPGCMRGIYRITDKPFPKGKNATAPKQYPMLMADMQFLLHTMNDSLKHMPKFEMREVEHSLCEFDKYERILHNDGRAKRVYR